MNRHARFSISFTLLLLAAIVPPAPWVVAPAAAQSIPWVGLSALGARLLGETGMYPHSPGAVDQFGYAVATGDFNGDGFDDLATGIPGNDCDFVLWDCGSVHLRLGGRVNLFLPTITLDPAHADAPGPADAFDEYGAALAVGDFDADGLDDLAVGIPGDVRSSASGQPFHYGGVQVHYGLPADSGNIQRAAEHRIHQPSNGRPDERFGAAFAVGDFNGDGHDDLAIGAPENWKLDDDLELEFQAGNVYVAHGHDEGLVPLSSFEMKLGLDALPDVEEPFDEFGHSLAAGDFDGDGFDDLAIGVPNKDGVGKVLVVYGSEVSLIFASHRWFGSADIGGDDQQGMRFGHSLVAADFDGDGRDDLAIGSPHYDGQGETILPEMGFVATVYGPPLDPLRVHWLHDHLLFGPGNGEAFDRFGTALAAGDFDGNGIADLAMGNPGEGYGFLFNGSVGAVAVVPGRFAEGLTGRARQLRPVGGFQSVLFADPAGLIPDYRGGDPNWGAALAAGDFDGNGFADLAIGAPRRDQFEPTNVDIGTVAVILGQLFADGFETGDAGAWSFVPVEPVLYPAAPGP